jgi:peptide chain release factor 1
VFRVSGKKALAAFEHEAGGHRFQRVPPTEKRGRVQTSTVTVAVLEEPTEYEVKINPKDLDIKAVRGSGAGGQHRNVTDSCVVITHKPTGIKVRVDGGRSQHINRDTALGLLRARLKAAGQAELSGNRKARRRDQVGSGMRADKIRTIALQRDQATNHLNGRSMSAKKYLRGFIDELV